MDRVQVKKSEQITINKELVVEYDQPIKTKKVILKELRKALGDQCKIYNYKPRKIVYEYEHDDMKDFFLVGSITYLSSPHPIYKKRFQLKSWYKDFYNEHKDDAATRIRLIGIYHYEDLIVFVDFNMDDYIENKINSSAAHVYSNDIYQAVENGLFNKTDSRGNHITAIRSDFFAGYLSGAVAPTNTVFSLFAEFNASFPFGTWVLADQAYSEMKAGNWYQWKGNQWAGWWLEYKIDQFIRTKPCTDVMFYIGDKKGSGMLDLDLFFKQLNFYGDIKSSDIKKYDAPGNDKNHVIAALQGHGKIWVVMYEHETRKDSDHGYEMCKKWMSLKGTPYVEGGKISSASVMKHSVKYTKMKIFEINDANKGIVLSNFNQGRQASGASRKPKFMIKKRQVDNFIVFSHEV